MNKHWRVANLILISLPVQILVASQVASGEETSISIADQHKIDAALPAKAIRQPTRPRRLLIFGRNVGYTGHTSIAYANYAFTAMGRQTGAFEAVVSNDPEVFRPGRLREFDAVFFNNNVGNLFQEPELRQSLVDFVYAGGGMLGVHGTTVAFTEWPGAREDWPEFGRMLGGRGANHKDNNEHVVIKLDDATHPLNAPFAPSGFDYRDEFFRVHGPYSRSRLRVLQTIDTEKTDLTQGGPPRGQCSREDNDYAVAWIRNYGRGRVFYCTIAHNPYVFWDPRMLRFYLGAIQFALGDLPAPTTPSARLTPAVRARESLGWCLQLSPETGRSSTLFESIALAERCQLHYVGAYRDQRISDEIDKPFDEQLTAAERERIRLRLDDAGVRLLTYAVTELPEEDEDARKTFQFARDMGAEMLHADALPFSLAAITPLSQEFDLRVSSPALKASHGMGQPSDEQLLQIAHDIDLTEWIAEDLGGITLTRRGPNRIFSCRLPALPVSEPKTGPLSPQATERRLASTLQMLARPLLRPVIVRVVHAEIDSETPSSFAASIEMFDRVCVDLQRATASKPDPVPVPARN